MAYQGKPIIAIDFDGTIRKAKRYDDRGTALMPNCKRVIKKLYNQGFRLIVWSCRSDIRFIQDVLKKHDILKYFEEINENVREIRVWKTRKVYADYYIDDLNLQSFPGWLKVWDIINERELGNNREAEMLGKYLYYYGD